MGSEKVRLKVPRALLNSVKATSDGLVVSAVNWVGDRPVVMFTASSPN